MKKIALLLSFATVALASNAQYSLSGSAYSQSFDGIGTSIPTGWFLYTGATSTSLGTIDATYGSGSTAFGAYFDTTDCPADVFGHGFKNCASADNGSSMATSTCLVQQSQTNRALGVRQASNTSYPGFDPGPSFAFEVANTTGDTGFHVAFRLQSLDQSCPRITTWTLDYGLGASPSTFTPVTTSPATITTGGSIFSNQLVTANLPAAVNNQSQPVWIRISTLTPTSGSGNRTTSAIDDFTLYWDGFNALSVSNVPSQPSLSLSVIGQVTSENIKFAYNAEVEGAYNFSIYDLTGRVLHNETINSQSGNQTITLSGLQLVPGMYIAKMGNNNCSSVTRIMVF